MTNPFDIFRKSRIFKRYSIGARVDGKWVEDATPDDVQITASLQPVQSHELQQLPEGRRTDQTFKMYTDTKLKTVQDQNPDLIVINGREFEVYSVASWQNDVVNHYKVIIMAKDGDV